LSGAPLRTGLQLPLAGALRDEVHTNFEQKWSGPDGVVIDVSHTAGKARTDAEDSLALSLAPQQAWLLQGKSCCT
jgi:hypothetical protein